MLVQVAPTPFTATEDAEPHARAPSTLRSGPWLKGRHHLRFQLGELTLGYAGFPALIQDVYFLDRPDAGRVPDAPFDRYPDGVEMALFPSHPLDVEVPSIAEVGRAIRYLPGYFDHYHVDLRGSFEEYLARIPAKSRHELTRKVKKLVKASGQPIDRRTYRTPAEIAEFHPLAREVSALTYQEKMLHFGLPDTTEFRSELALQAERDGVRGYLLFLGGRPVAYGYCEIKGDVVFYEHTGYDPSLRDVSPGIVLLHGMLEDLFGEGRFRVLDMGMGEAQYKRTHATGARRCAHVMYFRPTVQNRALVHLHHEMNRAAAAASGLLERAGLKARVREMLRRFK